jgi:hypothetical protein
MESGFLAKLVTPGLVPGHDEKASHFHAIGRGLKMLDALSVILPG